MDPVLTPITAPVIAGILELVTANIDNPTELNAIGTAVEDLRLVHENVVGSDRATLYRLDATTDSVSAPYIMASATAGLCWVAITGYAINQIVNIKNQLNVGFARIITPAAVNNRNLFIGNFGGNTSLTSDENTGIGYSALHSLTGGVNPAGFYNTAVGSFSQQLVTTGYKNVSVGRATLDNETTGFSNTACGYGSLHLSNTGQENTGLGHEAGHDNVSGANNTAVGSFCLWKNTVSDNTAVGRQAAMNTLTGGKNCSFGENAHFTNSSGVNSCSFGYNALLLATSDNNAAFGYLAGATLVGGARCTLIGAIADVSVNSIVNATAIGYGATVGASNTMELGGTVASGFNTKVSIRDNTATTALGAGSLVTGGGASFAGSAFVGGTTIRMTGFAGDATLSVRCAAGGNARYLEFVDETSNKLSWLIGAQKNLDNAFEITPSTAAGGTTYSTPVFVISSGSRVLIGTNTDDATNKLQVNGTAKIAGTTDSTSSTTGTVINSGGAAIAKNIIHAQGHGAGVASNATVSGTITLTNTSKEIQTFTGSTAGTVVQFPAANLFGAGIAVLFTINNQSSVSVTPTRAGADTFQGGGTTDPVGAGATTRYASDGVSLWMKC